MHIAKDCHLTLPVVSAAIILFLTLVDIQIVHCGITDQIDKQFNTYTFIEPKLIHARHKREIQSTRINPDDLEHVHGIELKFVDKGKEYIIDLVLNKELIPVNYFEKYQKDGAHVINKPNADELEFCNYYGKIRGLPNSWAAISTCDGIRGMFYDGNVYHYIEIVKHNSSDIYHVLYRHDDLKTNHSCGFPNTSPELIPDHIKRAKRNTRSLKGPYNENDRSRFIELVLVVDQEEYKSFNNNLPKVYQHTKDIANIINSLFIPLNIFITLVGVVVWTEYNEITLDPNGDVTLTNFLHYRREHLVKDHPNDNAQLLTKVQFENGIVGKALKGPICTFEFSGGVNSDHSFVKGLVATTIAHEIGHNLGMEHDGAHCECPAERCVMAPSSGALSPTHWSSCSMEYLALAFEHGMDYCLRNKPEKLFDSPVCGNSFVEEGEQCDCGIKELCNNSCCNPETCMLHENATCATGQCCDLNTCHLKSAGLECRSAIHECDLPEYCSGESEYCPDNVFKIDGSSCDMNKAFCYEGSCRTHTDQCRLLWGPTGESSSIQCYKMNNKGSQQGNCGFNRLNKTYVKCNNENVHCGMLHCKHKNERLEFGMETVSIVSHAFINNAGSLIPCRTAIVDLGLNEVDPGLTPDGAKCGENMMCVNQKCMAVGDLRAKKKVCPYDCNGNGVCNNKGNCHCKTGYSPPYCDHPGPGGSDDSGPASSPNTFKGFMTGMYVLTFGAIPLLLAVLLFAYCSKHSSSDWNKTNRKKLPKDAETGSVDNKPNGGGTVSPSSTLLLIGNDRTPTALQMELSGNYKGFSIKPLTQMATANEQQPTSSRTPVRPAPCPPPSGDRLHISRPVLDATTSSAVRELLVSSSSVPLPLSLKPAPPVPTAVATPRSAAPAIDNKNGGRGYPTLRRITSFMKHQKQPEEKKPATAVRANAKFDRELLKNLEISQPILQNEINVPSEPLPLEADRHMAVVLRAQSLRSTNNTKHRPSVPNFGSMRSSKRPSSVATATAATATATACTTRPTSPPPQPPSHRDGYQIPPLRLDHDDNDDGTATHFENIYSVIDESTTTNRTVDNKHDDDDDDDDESTVYKVPRSLESSLLGEIVSAIQERNHDSIYASKPQQQTYENLAVGSTSSSSLSGSTTSSGYVRPVDAKLPRTAPAPYDRPDLVKNCDENRLPNRSPDVLEAEKQRPTVQAVEKPTVPFPKPTIGAAAARPAATATVGLKKKLSDGRRAQITTGKVADVQKMFETGGR